MLNTKENIDFKKVNTNLKKELSLLGFDISNQSCLNLLSRAIGYQNYNTYLGLNPEIIKIDKISIKNFLKEENAIYLRIDPPIMYQEINTDGNKIEGGKIDIKAKTIKVDMGKGNTIK